MRRFSNHLRHIRAYCRTSLALLLIIAMTTVANATRPLIKDDPVIEEQETKLKPEEEREAIELIERFTSRYEETNDLTPLLDEFFVEDFAARRAKYPEAWLPYAFICHQAAGEASEKEWRRYYAAMINLWYWGSRLYHASDVAEREDASEKEIFEAVLSPEILGVLKEDFIFMEMFGDEDEKRKAKGSEECNTFECACSPENLPQDKDAAPQASMAKETDKGEDYGISVKTVERMNRLSAMMEKAVSMMHEKWEKLKKVAANKPIQNYSLSSYEEKIESPYVTIVDEDFFGYPAGTRLICYQAFGLHLCMIRDHDGRLKILSLGASFADD